MHIYLVGGAVRDALMGLPVQDRDWVVVGATVQDMLAQGFVPVGKDFPVFLHPQTHEEYALARTERKSAPGYRGFVVHAEPTVTLEEDLARRDITINAIAQAPDGTLVDPYGGQRDIAAQALRHVSTAFTEDPVRILRVARFAARFGNFTVAPETLALMRQMVAHGEADHLVPERVWQELARGLQCAHPQRMLQVLHACGALERALPHLDVGAPTLQALHHAAQLDAPLPVRFACLVTLGLRTPDAPDAPASANRNRIAALCEHLRMPTECSELAQVVARERQNIDQARQLDAAQLVNLLERCDALRKPARLPLILQACACLFQADHTDFHPESYPQAQRVQSALQAAQGINTATVAEQARAAGASGAQIGEHIHAARVLSVQSLLP